MTTTMIRVLLDFTKMTFAVLIARANAVYVGLNNNPAYPNPPVAMSALRAAIDDYSAAAAAAALDGGSKAVALKNALGDALSKMLCVLANYVEVQCNGDVTTFLSSGFQAKNGTRTRTTGSVSESIRKIAHGATGEFLVTFVPVSGAATYLLRWAPASGGSPGPWETVGTVQATRATSVSGLAPGTPYVFQACAVTRSGATKWSEPVTRMCA